MMSKGKISEGKVISCKQRIFCSELFSRKKCRKFLIILPRFIIFCALFLFLSSPLFSSGSEESQEIKIQLLNPLPLSLNAGETLTVRFQLENRQLQPQRLLINCVLPEGWNLLFKEDEIELQAKEKALVLSTFYIPRKTRAGSYQIIYLFSDKFTAQEKGKLELEVDIKPQIELEWQRLVAPHWAIAGDDFTCRFLLINRSNLPVKVNIQAEGNWSFPLQVQPDSFHLDPEEEREISIVVKTKKDLAYKIRYHLLVAAIAQSSNLSPVTLATSNFTEVIPLAPRSKTESEANLALYLGTIALAEEVSPARAQFFLTGQGCLDQGKKSQLNFLLRGPSQDRLRFFGYFPDEYKIEYQSPEAFFFLGDRIFSLSRLTQYGVYGRGLALGKKLSRLEVKGFYLQSPHINESNLKQGALKLELKASRTTSLALNFSQSKKENENYLLSLQARREGERSFFEIEMATGENKGDKNGQKFNYAFWLDFSSRFKHLSLKTSFLQASPYFPGFYQNLTLASLAAAYSFDRGEWHLSYSQSFRHKDGSLDKPTFLSLKENHLFQGFNLHLSSRLFLRLDTHFRQKKYDESTLAYNYQEQYVRFGLDSHWTQTNFSIYSDYGLHRDNLTSQHQRYLAGGLSLSGNLSPRIYLGGHLRWRNIRDNFSLEEEKDRELNFMIKASLPRTTIQLLHRTVYHRRWMAAYFDSVFWDNYFYRGVESFAELIFEQRLFHHHVFRLNVRYLTDVSSSLPSRWLALVEYKIPLPSLSLAKKEEASISGRIFAGSPFLPLSGIRLWLNGQEAVSNRQGAFFFPSLKEGTYSLAIDLSTLNESLIPATPMPLTFDLKPGENRKIDIFLVKPAVIRGKIEIKERLDSIILPSSHPGLSFSLPSKELPLILIELSNERETLVQRTNPQGKFILEGVRPGRWQIKARAESFSENFSLDLPSPYLEVKEGEEKEITLYLEPRQPKMIYLGELEVKTDSVSFARSKPEMETSAQIPCETISSLRDYYLVQLGAFKIKENARQFCLDLRPFFPDVSMTETNEGTQIFFKVVLKAANKTIADQYLQQVSRLGYRAFLLPPLHAEKEKERPARVMIQVASFRERNRAQQLQEELKSKYPQVKIVSVLHQGQLFYRVQIPSAAEEANRLVLKLKKEGFSVWIVGRREERNKKITAIN